MKQVGGLGVPGLVVDQQAAQRSALGFEGRCGVRRRSMSASRECLRAAWVMVLLSGAVGLQAWVVSLSLKVGRVRLGRGFSFQLDFMGGRSDVCCFALRVGGCGSLACSIGGCRWQGKARLSR